MSDRYSIDASAGSVDFLRPPHAEAPVPRMVLPGGKERKVTIGDARKEITDVNQVYEQRKLSIATHRSGHREVDSSPAGPPRLSMGSHRGAVGHSLAMSPGEILPPSPALSREWKAVRVADLPPDAQARAVDTAGLSRLDVARMKSQYGIRQTTGILQRSEIEQVRKRALEDHSSLVTVTKSIAGRAGLVRYDVDPQTQAVTLRATRTKIAEGGGKTIFKVLNMGVPEELQREQGIAIEATGKRGSQKLAAKDEYYGLLLAEQKNPNIVCYRRFDYRESTVTQMEFCGGGDLSKVAKKPPLAQERGERLRYCSEVASGLSGLHRTGHVHNDMKLENVLLTEQGGTARLSDFDRVDTPGRGLVGYTALYASPGSPMSKVGSFANDRHALGIMIFEMTHGMDENPVNTLGEDGVRASEGDHRAKLAELLGKLDLKNPVDKLISDLLDDHPEKNPLTKKAEAASAVAAQDSAAALDAEAEGIRAVQEAALKAAEVAAAVSSDVSVDADTLKSAQASADVARSAAKELAAKAEAAMLADYGTPQEKAAARADLEAATTAALQAAQTASAAARAFKSPGLKDKIAGAEKLVEDASKKISAASSKKASAQRSATAAAEAAAAVDLEVARILKRG